MNTTEILTLIQQHVKAEIVVLEDGPEPGIRIPHNAIFPVLEFLRNAPELDFNTLMNQTAVHENETIRLFWHLFSYSQKHRLTAESVVPLDNPKVNSVTPLWKAANWLERETFDLFGVEFDGHPDLRRIMLPEDWEGYPLRKDYIDPNGYGDIDNSSSEIDKCFTPMGR